MIYLDNSATTQVDPRVLKEMLPYFSDSFGNASSLHQAGLDNRVAVDRSQAKIAEFLGCSKEDVYFTSGATESDNMAIFGVVRAYQPQYYGLSGQLRGKDQKFVPHIVTTQIEHDAILEPSRVLEKAGVEVTFLSVNNKGLVDLGEIKKAIKPNTVLISVMYVNNEIGTIEPIEEIGKLIKELNQDRDTKIIFHTDATQAPSYVDCDVKKLNVDLMSLSGHKIYGPKGVGIIYIKKDTLFSPMVFGGHQQENVRPGTYNVSGIVGLGAAVELLLDKKAQKNENTKIQKLRDHLIDEITKQVPDTIINGDLKKRTPNNVNFIFKGVEGESVVLMLSEKGIASSTGSACSSGSLDPSHVLIAIGVKPELAHGSLRFTLGRFTTKEDIEEVIKELPKIVERLRKMSPVS